MKTEHGQTHLDLTVIGYGNQAAFFKIGNDNVKYQPTIDLPYSEMQFPIPFAVGSDLVIDNSAEIYIIGQMKVLKNETFKAATGIEFTDFNHNDFDINDFN
jgi:hypothetical protein